MAKDEEKTKVSFYFNKKAKVQPKGFGDINIGEDLTVIVKGKASSISENKDEWDQGKRFGMDIKSCEIIGLEKKTSLDQALKETRKKID